MSISNYLVRSQFNQERLAFYDDLAQTLDDQGNPKDFFAARMERYRSKKQMGMAQLYQGILQSLGRNPMSTALSGIIPKDEVMLLAAAETAGETVFGIRFIIKKINEQQEMTRALISAGLMPFALVTAIFALYIWVGYSFLPLLDQMFPHHLWKGMSVAFYWLSFLAKEYGIFFYGLFALGFVAWVWSLANWSQRWMPLRTFLDRFPPYRSYREMQAATFLLLLSALLDANVALRDAITRIRDLAPPYLSSRLQLVLSSLIRSPDNPGAAMERSGLFDEKVSTRLIEYGKRTNFEGALKKIGEAIVASTLRSVKRDAKLLGIVGLLVVGASVGFAFLNIILLPNDATAYLKSRF